MYPISIQSFPSIPFVRSRPFFVTGYKEIDIVEPPIKGCVTEKYFSLIPEAIFISVGISFRTSHYPDNSICVILS